MKYNKDNPLRVFEAFAGYGSQSLALQELKDSNPEFDFKVVGFSEIEDAPIRAFEALHPGVKNYGDICAINWDEVPDFDLFTYSSPCFVKGTLVMTKDGLKNIENIKTDDYVLSHDNQYHNVRKIGCKSADWIIKVKGMGGRWHQPYITFRDGSR